MKHQILARAAILAVALFSLAGCGDLRSALGMDRHVPDETQVVSRPALTLPPDYNLRPPGAATPVSAEHESGTSLGQAGTAGEQALQNSAAAAAPKKEEEGFFGRVVDFIFNPFGDDTSAQAAQPAPTPSGEQQPAPPATPTQSINGTPAPSGK